MKKWLKENRAFVLLLVGLALFRTAVADWNPIPSGSMRPNLLEGDVVLVDRLAYDLKLPLTNVVLWPIADPKRGDIVTFYSPRDGIRLIKRIVALPGDRVEMRQERLFINGEPARYGEPQRLPERDAGGTATEAVRLTESVAGASHRMQVLMGIPAHSSFGPMTVPAGQYLMLGDNRDNSADSRYFGFVPRNLLIGRAHHILVSADIKGDWLPRFERFGQRLL